MTTQDTDINTLSQNLNRLISCFPQWGNRLPWSQVLFAECTAFEGGQVPRIHRSDLVPFEDYAQRFVELLNSGYHWINMNAFGIWKDNLIVVIELPTYKSNVPRHKVAVNFSGPAIKDGKPQWDMSNKIEIIE